MGPSYIDQYQHQRVLDLQYTCDCNEGVYKKLFLEKWEIRSLGQTMKGDCRSIVSIKVRTNLLVGIEARFLSVYRFLSKSWR